MRILWIDDEVETLKPYVYLLRERGYTVDTATNGPDGIRRAKEGGYDLIFVDQMMPGMDGIEVVSEIKNFDPSILVVMVTKLSEEELMEEAYSKLVDDFITKPFSPPQIVSLLKRLLEKQKIFRERLARDYLQFLREKRKGESFEEWLSYYLEMIRWRSLLERFGEEGLKETYTSLWREANEDFSHFVSEIYPLWLEGKENPPILSHQVFSHFLLPQLKEGPLYFFVFDSMRLDQWQTILLILREDFNIRQFYYLSLLPSATPYSRNALLSGLLPLKIYERYPSFWVFSDTGQNRYEKELLHKLLEREGVGLDWFYLKVLRSEDLEENRGMLLRKDLKFCCIIINFLDFLIHSVHSTRLLEEILENEFSLLNLTRTWFLGSKVYSFLKELGDRDLRIVITSDHGFVKVKRPTLIYGGMEISPNLRYKYGSALRIESRNAFLFSPERLKLPKEAPDIKIALAKSDFYFIYPTKPTEYERTYKATYQHGGISLDEMILPLAILERR
uniref:Response regulator n=1 Tax=candidate division WOR-3 bacterium TaxID=2052148 RepID=A0A7C3Z233_UNCW3